MTADRVLSVARGEIGTKESPAGSNRVKYNTAYYNREVSGDQYPWCAVFVWWVFAQAGASRLLYNGGKTAWCPNLMTYHKSQKVTGGYKPGDVIFFNFSGKTSAAHVGICESWDGQYITTIDGNTGTDNEANGGAVMRRKRAKKYIVGAYRPAYETAKTYAVELPLLQKGSSGGAVRALQLLLTGLGHDTKGVDGQFGANTERALEGFQRARGLTADRKCGPASWSALLGG